MRLTISATIRAAIPAAAFTLVITSCQKTQDIPSKSNSSKLSSMLAVAPCVNNIPDTLQVPDGNKFAAQVYAKGVQIYQVQQSTTDPNVFKWVFIAPSATLYANANYTNPVGDHYAGPTWDFTKGFNKDEKTIAKKLKEANVDASAIAWLLLKSDQSLSSLNNKVTYVQRVCTEGGLAPVTGADKEHLGDKDSIPYTAVYLFYTAKR